MPGGEGLSYYNARWYDAQLGRFISADTLVPDPGDPQALNRLAYTLNNPLGYTDPSGHDPVKSCNGNRLCLAVFFLLRSGNMFDTRGLDADWGRLRNEVWYGEQRPQDIGIWTIDEIYLVDRVNISRDDYVRDIRSRPAYEEARSQFSTDITNNPPPEVGDRALINQPFTLEEAAMAERYNAVEWYLGSHTYSFYVTDVNSERQTAEVLVSVKNYSGWESATREPGGFSSIFGTSLLPNRGGRETKGAGLGTFLLNWVPAIRSLWSSHGETYSQSFYWTETIGYSYSEPSSGPR